MGRRGFTEVVMTTANAARLSDFFITLGWTHKRLPVTQDSREYFDLHQACSDNYLLTHPVEDCTVRLLEVPTDTPVWRPLDTELIVPGGLFDINMRTHRSDVAVSLLKDHGWTPLTEPLPWQFGDNSVKEFLAMQDDGVVLAVMERISPPLPGPPLEGMSDIFNATQIVQDHDRTLEFLEVLGFNTFVDFSGPLPGEGARVLNLEDYSDEEGHIRLTISHPDGLMQGSIEVISTPHQQRSTLTPINGGRRGLSDLRLPCANIQATFSTLVDSPWVDAVHKPLKKRDLGGNDGWCFAVLTPDGARLDVYEADEVL